MWFTEKEIQLLKNLINKKLADIESYEEKYGIYHDTKEQQILEKLEKKIDLIQELMKLDD